jgi:dienelactone hydrolase
MIKHVAFLGKSDNPCTHNRTPDGSIMRNLIFIIAIALALIFAVFSLFYRRWPRKSIRRLCVIGGLLCALALGYFWCSPAWSYPAVTGPYGVASAECTYTDDSRVEPYESDGSVRWLNVAFWYPANYAGDDNTCPLVVFSHGSFGTKESNVVQYRELASHGYVVCAIDHTYQCLSAVGPNSEKTGLDSGFMKQVMQANDDTPEQREKLVALFRDWMAVRTGDINFVLDTVLSRADADDGGEDGVYRLVDTKRIGVMGHSMGGAAALAVGRMRDDVSAVIALEAPFMGDVQGVTDSGFTWDDTPYPIPVLNVYTDNLWDRLDKSPQYAQNNAMLQDDRTDTQDIYVPGAGHMTLTDLVYEMPPLCLLFGQNILFNADTYGADISKAYLDFFDAHLKGGEQA